MFNRYLLLSLFVFLSTLNVKAQTLDETWPSITRRAINRLLIHDSILFVAGVNGLNVNGTANKSFSAINLNTKQVILNLILRLIRIFKACPFMKIQSI